MFNDILGNIVQVGDFVAYGVRSGNSGGMGVGKILEIKIGHRVCQGAREPYTITDYAIKVRGFEMQTYGAGKGFYRICRPGTLNTPSRIVRLREADIPSAVIALYD